VRGQVGVKFHLKVGAVEIGQLLLPQNALLHPLHVGRQVLLLKREYSILPWEVWVDLQVRAKLSFPSHH
jgi:hypothetical protein